MFSMAACGTLTDAPSRDASEKPCQYGYHPCQDNLHYCRNHQGFGQLSTSLPHAFHIAIKRNRKITTPLFPKVEIHHYTESILDIGVKTMYIDGFNVRLYDVERCVCDAVKFRNKVGMDVCSEIINNYLERPERNLSKLMDYARKLRIGKILEQYLQVKL